ncbi:crystallin, alpha B, a [Rhinichthys klamathensis goyatoka]|uniref:crystallin, alpha B, a n=1 Tax=Rhinichthys klamathensis goyatoka TaxID=3034132 RepID=UPI0024B53AAA|nr:crystallin, alpha B, a [Rhinichthys klamathensis goyatoka]
MDISIYHPWYRRPLFPGFFPSSHRTYDQYFGERLPVSDLFSPFYTMLYYRPYFWRFPNWWESGMSDVRMDRDRFVISLDVKHFSPDELTDKLNDDFIEIHGKHDERQGTIKIPAGPICIYRHVQEDISCEEKPPAQK